MVASRGALNRFWESAAAGESRWIQSRWRSSKTIDFLTIEMGVMEQQNEWKCAIIGAGSIGNHMANAARTLGWSVLMVDRDSAALSRTKTQIYPDRYGSWDEEIVLCEGIEQVSGAFDLIVVGTPPSTHLGLAVQALELNPRAVLIEKPLTSPEAPGPQDYAFLRKNIQSRVFVGYQHSVSESVEFFLQIANAEEFGQPLRLEVDILEHWQGIFQAHPWLKGPQDSYLGSWKEGGGALSEHSHGLNLWQHIARSLGQGEVIDFTSSFTFTSENGREYDRAVRLELCTSEGLRGSCSQDVITSPAKKAAKLQGSAGYVEVQFSPVNDRVLWSNSSGGEYQRDFAKSRPSDFIRELSHIQSAVESASLSPLDLIHGRATSDLIATIFKDQWINPPEGSRDH